VITDSAAAAETMLMAGDMLTDDEVFRLDAV